MRNLNDVQLAVQNPLQSARLYTKLLGCSPVEESETFVLFVLPPGLKVGLWLAREVVPGPGRPGGGELSFSEPSREALERTHADWKQVGLEVLQEPTDMDFGDTFVVADPDGHRLRPFVLAERPS
jgi:catechol 2,3-dioxygenase-like lactoylglutathione lyase family enzyme